MERQAAHPSRRPPAEKSTPPSSQRTQDHGQHPKSEGWSSKRKGNAKCSLSSWIKVYPFPAQPTKPSVKTIRGARGRGWGDRQHTHPANHRQKSPHRHRHSGRKTTGNTRNPKDGVLRGRGTRSVPFPLGLRFTPSPHNPQNHRSRPSAGQGAGDGATGSTPIPQYTIHNPNTTTKKTPNGWGAM